MPNSLVPGRDEVSKMMPNAHFDCTVITPQHPADEPTMPPKKKRTVRWKDLEDTEAEKQHVGNTDTSAAELFKHKQRSGTKRRSPSPPLTNLMEVQQQMHRQEAAIRHACKLELQLLNQAKQVREKRSRMVDRLQRLKRKVRKLTADAAIAVDDGFVLPPVYGKQQQLKPCVVDMTTGDDDDDMKDRNMIVA